MSQKTLFFTPFLILVSMSMNAQFKKGDRMVGATVGSLVYNSGNSDITVVSVGSTSSKSTGYDLNIIPSLGWFISDNTAVGFTLNINPSGQKVTYEQGGSTYQSDKSNSFDIGLGGFARNYFKSSGSMKPFGQVGINGGISSFKTEGFFYGGSGPGAYKITYDGETTGGGFFNANFAAGITKMVGDHTGLDFFIGYIFSYNKNTFKKTTLRDDGINGSIEERLENETITKFTNHGFTVGVGFQVFLAKRK